MKLRVYAVLGLAFATLPSFTQATAPTAPAPAPTPVCVNPVCKLGVPCPQYMCRTPFPIIVLLDR